MALRICLLKESAAEIGFHWGPDVLGWERPGLPALSTGPIQPGRSPFFDFSGILQLLNSSHVRERDKALLRSVLVGCVEWLSFK